MNTMPATVAAALRALGPSVESPSTLLRAGVDVADLRSLRRLLDTDLGDPFLKRVFAPEELAYCRGDIQRLGGRWAAKEAVAKAIGTGFRDGLNPSDIVVAHDPASGAPLLHSRAGSRWPDGAVEWAWSLSIAHESDVAIAIAIAIARA